MTSMRPGAPGKTTTPGTADMTDNAHDDSRPLVRGVGHDQGENDQGKHDPAANDPLDETTSAADADWLAELRATAKERNTSLADVVTDLERDLDADNQTEDDAPAKIEVDIAPDDDESTIGSPTALDDIRRVAREERVRATAAAQLGAVDRAPENNVNASNQPQSPSAASSQPPRSAAQDVELRPAERADTPSAPPMLRSSRPDLRPDRAEQGRQPGQVAPRWEAPPRLEAAADSSEPAFLDRSGSAGRADWRITALAVVAAVLLGVVLSLLFLNNDAPTDPVDEDPDSTTVVEGSTANDTEQPEVGS